MKRQQKQELIGLLKQGALAAGYPTQMWTPAVWPGKSNGIGASPIIRGMFGKCWWVWAGVARSPNGGPCNATPGKSESGIGATGRI